MKLLLATVLVLTLLPVGVIPAPALAQGAAPRLPFPTAAELPGDSLIARGVALGDIDGDGALDLVLANQFFGSQIFLNDRWGGFQQPTALPEGWPGATEDAALGDLDADGDLDLVLANSAGRSQIFRNRDGIFGAPVELADSGPGTVALAVADLDSDGALDLVLANNGGPSQVYWNTGGAFGRPAPLEGSGPSTSAVAVGNVDNRGGLDLILGDARNVAQIYLGGPARSFTRGQDLQGIVGETRGLALGDFDADGALDLVLANRFGEEQLFWNNGQGVFARRTTLSTGGATTGTGAAVGDLDGDGDLDIVIGRSGVTQIYLNEGRRSFQGGIGLNDSGRTTSAVALGDLNGDGALDLVLANESGGSQLFYNSAQGGFSAPELLPLSEGRARRVALGDLTGDGALEIVLANQGALSQIYRNGGDGPAGDPTGLIGSGRRSRDVAVGDLDDDGDLDILLGNEGAPSQIFWNDRAGSFPAYDELPDGGADTNSVSLGDLDGDGDLDILLGSYFGLSLVFRNDGGRRFGPAAPLPVRDRGTIASALGDLDGDGDLDILLGNYVSLSQIYWNDGGRFGEPTELDGSGRKTRSVAVGDLDGDGDLDILLGNEFGANQIFRNDGRGQFPRPADVPARGGFTRGVALGDLDGDGALDLVAGNIFDGSQVYFNRGGRFLAPINLAEGGRGTTGVALGDLDGDGVPDIVLGNDEEVSKVIFRRSSFGGQLQGSPPRLRIGHPGLTPPAPLYARAEILSGRSISIPFTLADAEGDRVARVVGAYSLDGGGSWRPARPRALADTLDLEAPPQGARYSFAWDVYADGDEVRALFGASDNVVFRLTAVPSVLPRPGRVAGSYPHGAAVSTSLPFRVRGLQARVVRPDGAPAGDALVYRLPRGQVRGAAPLTRRLVGDPLASGPQGYVASRDPLRPGDRLVALWPISDTAKFTLYHTSAAPTLEGLAAPPIAATGVQTLTVRPEHPLMLLKLAVSLEWDARSDPAFLAQLQQDLARASELLYDWTDGQVALGELTLSHDKERWDEADIQIYASNRLNPNATQGGITPAERADPDRPTVRYQPGAVRIGATWSRFGDPGRRFGEDWPRALAHELGHFALYLDETYLGLDAQGRLVAVAGCPSPMADPYRDDFGELRPNLGAGGACRATLSYQSVGRTEWQTLKRFYDRSAAETSAGVPFTLNAPASFVEGADSGPRLLPLAVTALAQALPAAPPAALSPQLYSLTGPAGRYEASGDARAFLIRTDDRLVDLGAPTLDRLLARGARQGDRLCAFDLARRSLGCAAVDPGSSALALAPRPEWRPELLITPETSTTLRVALPAAGVGALPAGASLRARLFPSDGLTRSLTIPLALAGDGLTGTYAGAFERLEKGVTEGYVQVWVEGDGGPQRREIVSDFALGGAPAPQRRPKTRNKRRAPAVSSDGQATLFADDIPFREGEFFALQQATTLPFPPAWASPVAAGYRLLASDRALLGRPLSLNLSYAAGDVPLGLDDDVTAYFFSEARREWRELAGGRVPGRNEVTVRVEPEPGLYVLMASVRLRLGEPGWNLIFAYPGATQPLPAALAGTSPGYHTLYGYEPDDPGGDLWKVYSPGAPSWVNDLAGVEQGASYWIRSTQAITLSLRSPDAGPSDLARPLLPAPPMTVYAELPFGAAFDPRAGLPVRALVGDALCGSAVTRAVPGAFGFSIDILARGGGAAAGCGAEDALVTLQILDEAGAVLLSRSLEWDTRFVRRIFVGPPNEAPHTLFLPLARAGDGLPAGEPARLRTARSRRRA